MRYAIIEAGKVSNITIWDGVTPWTPSEGEAVACPDNVGIGWTYDGTTWSEPQPAAETSRWIEAYRFLFRLHDPEQQVMMDAVHSAGLSLTPAQIVNFDPGAVDAYGYPLSVLRVFRIAYEQMDHLGGRVDLLSQDMAGFFAAAASVGIYGNTPEEQQAEIDRVKADKVPDGSGS